MMYAGSAVLEAGDVHAEAFAFRMLVQHLRSVSEEASNIDIMSASGMCRNCLSKWYHAGSVVSGHSVSYEEACERVYGEPYAAWKKKHQKPATAEQMARFEATKTFHARHEKDLENWKKAFVAPTSVAADPCCYYDEEEEDGKEEDPPREEPVSIRLGVLTVSDRASAGTYADASGPAVIEGAGIGAFCKEIVPDDVEDTTCLLREDGGRGFWR